VDIHDKTLFTIVDESVMDSLLPTSVGKIVGRTYVGHDDHGKEVFKVHKNLSGESTDPTRKTSRASDLLQSGLASPSISFRTAKCAT
jgi:hypothetical protein